MSPAAPDASGGDLFAANLTGALLAVASSAFIGVSFIVKKKGLRRAAAAGARAGICSSPALAPRRRCLTPLAIFSFSRILRSPPSRSFWFLYANSKLKC